MTVRNRARLRQFDDPENLRRLINLPQTIQRALPRSDRLSYDQAVKLQSAVAIGILLDAPLRAKNLAPLHLGRHVVRTRAGGVRHFVVPAEETKNRSALAFEVSDSLGELIDVYLTRGRPILVKDADGYLFPARKGGAKTPAQLAEQIKHTIVQETEIVLNAHAFRHLSAKLFLAAHPGEYETVRLFLGLLRSRAGRRAAPARRSHRQSSREAGACLMTRHLSIAEWPEGVYMRAVIYARYSSDQQRATSIDD
jgi:integrase